MDSDLQFLFDEYQVSDFPDFYDETISKLKNGIENVDNDTKYYFLGLHEYRNNNFRKAMEFFEKAPNDSRALYMRAIHLQKENKLEESLELFLEAVNLGDHDAIVRLVNNRQMKDLFSRKENDYKIPKTFLAKTDIKRINTWGF